MLLKKIAELEASSNDALYFPITAAFPLVALTNAFTKPGYWLPGLMLAPNTDTGSVTGFDVSVKKDPVGIPKIDSMSERIAGALICNPWIIRMTLNGRIPGRELGTFIPTVLERSVTFELLTMRVTTVYL